MMSETPEEWLEHLFEFEFCAECGGDAEDHVVCLVPGIGNYFARCLGRFTRQRPDGRSQIRPKHGSAPQMDEHDTSEGGCDEHPRTKR